MALVPHYASVSLTRLALAFMLTLWVILIGAMGIVDGFKFRRVRLRYGVVVLATFRGVAAQIIGGLCILAELAGAALLITYIGLLRRYCGANAACFMTTPAEGLFVWPAIIGNGMVLFLFIYWLRGRHVDVSPPTAKLSYSLPTVYHHVNAKLTLAHEPHMNRPEVERIMEYVEERGPFVVLAASKQVVEGKRLSAEKLAAVFLAGKRFRDKGERVRIAVEAVTEAYVASGRLMH